jgi:hypothetical protein
LELIKQQIKSLVKGFIEMLKSYLAENNRNLVREIMVIIYFSVKMGFNFHIGDVKAFLGVHIMQIVFLRFIG